MPSTHLLHLVADWAAGHRTITVAAAIVAATALWFLDRQIRRAARAARRMHRPDATKTVATIALAVCLNASLNTSWRFTLQTLHIHHEWERAGLVGFYELSLLACALFERTERHAAAEANRKTAATGGLAVKVLAGLGVIPAFTVGGLVGGLWRFAVIIVGLYLFHRLVGIEITIRVGALRSSRVAKALTELGERVLSWFGLGDEHRTAAEIARDRALDDAVDLLVPAKRKDRRVRRKLRRSEVAHDPKRQARFTEGMAVAQNLAALRAMQPEISWTGNGNISNEATAASHATPVASEGNTQEGNTGNGNEATPGGNAVAPATNPATGNRATPKPAPPIPDDSNGNAEPGNVVVMSGRGNHAERLAPFIAERRGEKAPLPEVIAYLAGLGFHPSKASASRAQSEAVELWKKQQAALCAPAEETG